MQPSDSPPHMTGRQDICPCPICDKGRLDPLGATQVQAPRNKTGHGKLEWSLIPRKVLRPVIRVFMYGARKYSREGWRDVPDAQRIYGDAAKRHLDEWWTDPSSRDPETGESHLAHLVCCILILMALEELE
jgi:hypothetical protein